MIVFGGTDVICCKMFTSTFTSVTLQWFSGFPDGHITFFAQSSRLFRDQFFVNQIKPPKLYDLFNVRQREEELLKDYLNRLWALTVRLQTHDKDVMVPTFKQGIAAGPFSDSLDKNPAETFSEIRERVVTHIEAEEVVARKNNSSYSRKPRPTESSRARPLQVHDTSTLKRTHSRYVPYVAKRNEPKTKAREESVTRPKF